jgi:hypothetical protein
MAFIKVLVPVGGLDFSWQPEQIVEVTDEQAAAWADGIRAEHAEDPNPPKPAK